VNAIAVDLSVPGAAPAVAEVGVALGVGTFEGVVLRAVVVAPLLARSVLGGVVSRLAAAVPPKALRA